MREILTIVAGVVMIYLICIAMMRMLKSALHPPGPHEHVGGSPEDRPGHSPGEDDAKP